MPNAFASLALVLWPAICVLIFVRLPPGRALIASVLIGYLFLPPSPAGFDFPLVPELDKESILALSALFAGLMTCRGRIRLWPESRAAQGLLAAFVLSPVLTVLTNPDPVIFGNVWLPGMRVHDMLGLVVAQAIALLPFVLARSLLGDADDLRDLLAGFMLAGLVYSLPMLIEVRLSPQLNIWIYGFFQHSFDQMIRFGGYRPIVFLYHGLWVAFFMSTAVLAAVALARGATGRRALALSVAAIYLLVVLVLCKSAAALLYAMALVPVIAVLGQRLQLSVALLLAALAVSYPLLKGGGAVPEQALLSLAERVDENRADSLEFRFDNENALLDRASAKPLFGWGSWGRNLIYDPDTGRQVSVADGEWIIAIGTFGWVGFLAEFGLLALPVLLLWRAGMAGAAPAGAGALALMLAVNLVDMLPNATITPLTWLVAGAVLGLAERAGRSAQRAALPGRARPEPLRTVL